MTTDMTELSRRGRAAYWVVAVLAWAGVAATLIITAFDGYAPPTYYEEGLFAVAAHGWAGAPERLINCLSYFTELSNIMVAIISTLLARRGRVGAWGRATHLCALMMITVTAIVYATLIGPYETLSGFALVTNPLQHIVVPAAFVAAAALGAARWHHVGDARARSADPARVGGVHARARLFHAPVPLRLRERVASRLRAGRDQHCGDPDRRPGLHGTLRGRGLANPQGVAALTVCAFPGHGLVRGR